MVEALSRDDLKRMDEEKDKNKRASTKNRSSIAKKTKTDEKEDADNHHTEGELTVGADAKVGVVEI